ncbi:hypothetical protein [Ruegeria halocynthiae]|uniref:hypothetical protein n=1 Tax=Ruegeria halocynthiae TaxID=985054 RepID=UPI000A5DD796|nr:hypothetical protein [Ruegeria halocynthiae]
MCHILKRPATVKALKLSTAGKNFARSLPQDEDQVGILAATLWTPQKKGVKTPATPQQVFDFT